jgi:phage baseplate assembly protein W
MLFSNSIKFPNIFNLYSGITDTETEYTSINRCLALILTTAKGELLGDPDYGCILYEQLFNGYTEDVKDTIIDGIVEAIKQYEKRIVVYKNDVSIDRDEDNEHLYHIHISYKVKNTPFEQDTVVDVLERTVD